MVSDSQAPNVPPETPASKEQETRIPVMVRLDTETFRAMRLAMAHLEIRANQDFAAQAIAEKVARALPRKRSGDDRRRGERRAA